VEGTIMNEIEMAILLINKLGYSLTITSEDEGVCIQTIVDDVIWYMSGFTLTESLTMVCELIRRK
jgi:hypothetical protein